MDPEDQGGSQEAKNRAGKIDLIRIHRNELELACMHTRLERGNLFICKCFPRKSPHFMLDPTQRRGYEYILLVRVQVSENVKKEILVC